MLKTSEGEVICVINFFTCNLFNGLLLPCRQLSAVRGKLSLLLFAQEIINRQDSKIHVCKKKIFVIYDTPEKETHC